MSKNSIFPVHNIFWLDLIELGVLVLKALPFFAAVTVSPFFDYQICEGKSCKYFP